MTTQPEQTTVPTLPQPGTHHFIMTVQVQTHRGYTVNSWHGNFTPEPGSTRQDAFEMLRAQHDSRYPEMAGGVVLFFSLDRNQL